MRRSPLDVGFRWGDEALLFSSDRLSGTFSLDGLPEGDYTIEAWHETLGTQTKTVKIGSGDKQTVAFEFAQE